MATKIVPARSRSVLAVVMVGLPLRRSNRGQVGRTGTAIAPLKPGGTVPYPGLAEAFDHGRALGSAAANNIGQRGGAHRALDSRTAAVLSRTL